MQNEVENEALLNTNAEYCNTMDKDDDYVKQLHDIFNNYCKEGSGSINQPQLLKLCEGLPLNAECTSRLCHLAFPKSITNHVSSLDTIEFDEFCNCFVAALSEVSENVDSDSASPRSWNENEDIPDAEVKPRFVRGGRAYGRRSVPSGVSDDEKIVVKEEPVDESVQRVSNLSSNGSAFHRVDDNDSIYYEPSFHDVSTRKGDYFEANGAAEKVPSQLERTIHRKDTSTSQTVDSFADLSSVSILGAPDIDLFSSLCLDGSSMVEVDHLMELWRRGGVNDPQKILEALEFKGSGEFGLIDGCELSSALEREVLSPLPLSSTLDHVMTCALIHSYKHHLLHTDSQLNHYRHQVEKMKDDLERSEVRNSKILEEVDDRYLSLDEQHEKKIGSIERKWSKKFQSVQRSFSIERESILAQAASDREELLKEIDKLRSSESFLRRKVDVLTMENKTLSEDAVRMLEKLTEAEKDAERLRKDLECLLAAKTSDECDPVNTLQEEKFAMIIKDYEAQCRHLSDRNDELASEIKDLRSQLRHQEARRHSNQNLYHEQLMGSPSRKRPARGGSMSPLMELESPEGSIEDLSDIEQRNHPKFSSSNPNDSLASNFAYARMQELEVLVEDLRNERRKYMDNFAYEKAKLRSDLEEDFRAKLEEVEGKSRHYDDNKAVEEQQTMTMRLLEEITKERDELETQYKELKESVERETSSGEQGLADLCREFASEKAELVDRHEKQIKELDVKLNSQQEKLEKEQETNERLTGQLRIERSQHKAALSAHQEVISKFEKTTAAKDTGSDKLKELQEKHEEEVRELKRDHVNALEAVKRDAEEKLDQFLAERQVHDTASVCSELERLQETIGAERREMVQKIEEMRKSFEREEVELRQLLDIDKAKLHQQLSEEVAILRQRIAEEREEELRRRKQEVEEERKRLAEKVAAEQRKEEDWSDLRSEIEALKTRNQDLENSLLNATSSLAEQEERMKLEGGRRESGEALARKVEELKKSLIEKDLDNSSLRKQLDDVMGESRDCKLMTSSLRMRCDERTAGNERLASENRRLAGKVEELDQECSRLRIEIAGMRAKCDLVMKSAPTPKKRQNKREKEEREQIRLLEEEIAGLRSQLAEHDSDVMRSRGDVTRIHRDGENETALFGEEPADLLRRQLAQSRGELTEHMGRMKDLYEKLSKSELLVKDLYCENAHLMRALQVTEARQRDAEKRYGEEKEKNQVLGQLVKEICDEIV